MSEAVHEDGTPMKRGWTTGACAAAAAKAAVAALNNGEFPDPVTITLPGGQTPAFALARHELTADTAMVAIVKDAGDDPDVTHGALVIATVRHGKKGGGLQFRGGPGVGKVTLPGLPVPVGEPAINPAPRQMIEKAVREVSPGDADYIIEIAVPDGDKIAMKTLNPRLGILGGISILGTTGIVIPYSCAAWIHSIHRGIDVARAAGYGHVLGATGDTSEKAGQRHHGLDDLQLIDMGDFVGGMLKYLAKHPVPHLTIAGGVAKMTKLAQGMLDLHSKRGRADMAALAMLVDDLALAGHIEKANTVAEAFAMANAAGAPLGPIIAGKARETVLHVVRKANIDVEVLVFDRRGDLQGRAAFDHAPSRPRKRR